MNKLNALQQQSRRSNSFRGGTSPADSSGDGGATKSATALFWLVLHCLCCLISLILGFRFSRLIFYLLMATTTNPTPFLSTSGTLSTKSTERSTEKSTTLTLPEKVESSSRVVVGRHGILIRPWPHPDPGEVMRAHRIIESVQREQKVQYGVKNPRTIIAITPTYVRTFQGLHVTGLMHSLMNVKYDVVWIVVEAGGTSNETASLLANSGLRTIHVGFGRKMPITWEERHRMEVKMRLRGLRVVMEQNLDGIVLFADDSNMHSMELFDEIQNVKWMGAVSVGILAHSGGAVGDGLPTDEKEGVKDSPQLPVQGPACNASNQLIGWHTLDLQPFMERRARYIGDRTMVLPMKLEWSGFVLNSRLVWKDAEDKPEWVRDIDLLAEDGGDIESPLSLVKDASIVEPLGSCGRKVMLWWLRVEARADSKFPAGWIINPPLDINVPAKRTPWPEATLELPSTEKTTTLPDTTEKRTTKSRSPRRRSTRSKKKRVVRNVDENVSTKISGE
ncbi:hypothetical protein Leryth_015071 [Lithospermum erythrorhizon]|nr:hypothetical protein Leryth_015071 [Lithospermum erythrorhizon]